MRSVVGNSPIPQIAHVSEKTQPGQPLKSRNETRIGRNLVSIAARRIEPFIDAGEAAEFVQLNRKTLLRFAREGSIPAHPLTGNRRRKWRFLISELDAWARAKVNSTSDRCQNSRS